VRRKSRSWLFVLRAWFKEFAQLSYILWPVFSLFTIFYSRFTGRRWRTMDFGACCREGVFVLGCDSGAPLSGAAFFITVKRSDSSNEEPRKRRTKHEERFSNEAPIQGGAEVAAVE
jgi:hypothetical protein